MIGCSADLEAAARQTFRANLLIQAAEVFFRFLVMVMVMVIG